jgi:uncharacterized protein (TIGR03435 family)
VADYQIAPAPKWIDTAVKKAGGAASGLEEASSAHEERSLVRELLADRFHLTAHREAKQMAVFLLVVAKDGPRLKAHDDSGAKIRGGCGRLVGRRVTADGIATILSRHVDHEVVNRTSLAGEYDFGARQE